MTLDRYLIEQGIDKSYITFTPPDAFDFTSVTYVTLDIGTTSGHLKNASNRRYAILGFELGFASDVNLSLILSILYFIRLVRKYTISYEFTLQFNEKYFSKNTSTSSSVIKPLPISWHRASF